MTSKELGTFKVMKSENGRRRYRWSAELRYSVRCNAAAVARGDMLLLVSFIGPANAVKGVIAALQGDDPTITFRLDGPVYVHDGARCGAGYKVRKVKLAPDLWHAVAIAKVEGLRAHLDDEALWQELRSPRFTVPVLREWLPWLKKRLEKKRLLGGLKSFGCEAGLIVCDDEQLEALISEGLASGALKVPGASPWTGAPEAAGLDAYLQAHGSLLGAQAEKSLAPLHVPGRNQPHLPALLRTPFPAQADVIAAVAKAMRRQKAVVVVGEMGTGKAQPLDARVLTPGGWKRMGDMTVGDEVINPEGGTARVIGVYPQGEKEVFRVTFSDGSSTECCDEHLWLVSGRARTGRGNQWKVLPLLQIMREPLEGKNGKANDYQRFHIPLVSPVEMPKRELPINPYVLGVLLGDGCLVKRGTLRLTTGDAFLAEELAKLCPEISVRRVDEFHYDLVSVERGGHNTGPVNPLKKKLSTLGLLGSESHTKFIPTDYLDSCVMDRIDLLAGLLDTDGHVNKFGHISLTTTSLKLANDVRVLVQSLGGTASIGDGKPATFTVNGERKVGRVAWNVWITLPKEINPFRLPRKAGRRDIANLRNPKRAIVNIQPTGRKLCQCLALDSRNRLYVTDDYIVTHNTIMGMSAAHAHANGHPYRALVFCPGTLTPKWQRELESTVPGAQVTVIESWRDLTALDRSTSPVGPEWYVIARDRAKLGACWRPAFTVRHGDGYLRCPSCGRRLVDKDGVARTAEELGRKRSFCDHAIDGDGVTAAGCGEALWQNTREIDRYEPALYIKKHLRGHFGYLILDEVHEEKGANTAQANAAGALIAACRKVIALTGTLVGGYAEHLRPLLFRLAAGSLVEEGLSWENAMPFSERYGRIETRITERSGVGRDDDSLGDDNRMSRGGSKTNKTKHVRPGIMPPLFGRHLLDKAVFLSLAEVADNLPELEEECLGVAMDAELRREYEAIENDLREAIKPMLLKGDKRLLGTMLQTLLAYPDLPFDWAPVGYKSGEDGWVTVTVPKDLDRGTIRPKEQALIELCRKEKAAGRKVWVYVQYTDRHDVQARVAELLEAAGLTVGTLRSSVALAKREAWIAKNAPKVDVIVSHPKLVETGLDFFDKVGTYNVPTVVFYETGYNLFTLRQAARRAWRVGQKERCKVVYLYYEGTMQEKAMALMGKKMQAALALEGTFSEDGLAALAGEDGGSAEMALAKSLAEKIDLGDVRHAWGRPAVKKAKSEPTVSEPAPVQGLLWSADDLVAEMKAAEVTIPMLARELGVSEYRVRKARKEGLTGEATRIWAQAVAAVGTKRPPRAGTVARSSRAGAGRHRRAAAGRWNGSPQ